MSPLLSRSRGRGEKPQRSRILENVPYHIPDFLARAAGIGTQEVLRFPEADVPRHFRRAAVLILLWADGERVRTAITQRTSKMKDHAGEVCFPGGRIRPGETAAEAALREAREEIGLAVEALDFCGRLDDAWVGTGHHMTTYVSILPERPRLTPDPGEVEHLFEADVATLLDPATYEEEVLDRDGRGLHARPILRDGACRLYGQSAELLLELRDRVVTSRTDKGQRRLDRLRKIHPQQQ